MGEMAMDSKRTAKLVTFGKGGDTVYWGGHSTTSGYGNPDRPHAAAGEDIPDGTPALDTRPATDTDAGVSWVFKGPMVDPDLADGEGEECPEPSPVMAAGLSGSFLGLLAVQITERAKGRKRAGPLDYVSVSEYVAGWRDHGARVGRYEGGAIVWE
jgi:hypothetical protein